MKPLICAMLLIGGMVETAYAASFQASWYSEWSLIREGTWARTHGVMANGRRFNPLAHTCATNLYPLGTRLKLTKPHSKKFAYVVVTDRIAAKYQFSRIDLTPAVFKKFSRLKKGLVRLNVEVVRRKSAHR